MFFIENLHKKITPKYLSQKKFFLNYNFNIKLSYNSFLR